VNNLSHPGDKSESGASTAPKCDETSPTVPAPATVSPNGPKPAPGTTGAPTSTVYAPTKPTGEKPMTTGMPITTVYAPTKTTGEKPMTTGMPITTVYAPTKTTGEKPMTTGMPTTTVYAPTKTTGEKPMTTGMPITTVYTPTKTTGEKPMMTTAFPTETKKGPLCKKPKSEYEPYPRKQGEEDKVYLLLAEAGKKYAATDAIHVVDGDCICPDDYANGFSIVCDVPYDSKSVDFEVDGAYKRTEKMTPYAIQNDKRGLLRGWVVAEGKRTVRCVADDGADGSVDIYVGCGKPGCLKPGGEETEPEASHEDGSEPEASYEAESPILATKPATTTTYSSGESPATPVVVEPTGAPTPGGGYYYYK
jgi:hypothetical protein